MKITKRINHYYTLQCDAHIVIESESVDCYRGLEFIHGKEAFEVSVTYSEVYFSDRKEPVHYLDLYIDGWLVASINRVKISKIDGHFSYRSETKEAE